MTDALETVKLTYEDYVHLPDDRNRHELIDGGHVATPPPDTRHQRLVTRLFMDVAGIVHERFLGEAFAGLTTVVLSEHDVVQPDVLFVAREHLNRIVEAYVAGPPDLVVEIVSEATRRRDEVLKRQVYERSGVAELWLVDPVVEAVKVFWRGDAGGFERRPELTAEAESVLTSPFLPGLEIPLVELFG